MSIFTIFMLNIFTADDRDSSRKMGMQKRYWEPIIVGSFVCKDKHSAFVDYFPSEIQDNKVIDRFFVDTMYFLLPLILILTS